MEISESELRNQEVAGLKIEGRSTDQLELVTIRSVTIQETPLSKFNPFQALRVC